MSAESAVPPPSDLLNAFRAHYRDIEQRVMEAMNNLTDPTILASLGDDLDTFLLLVVEVSLLSFACIMIEVHYHTELSYIRCY